MSASNMSSQGTGMVGFNWPTRAGSSPSRTTDSASPVSVSSLAMTSTVSATGVLSSLSPSVAVSATAGSQRTTRVQVTHTTTVTPTVTVGMDASPSVAVSATSGSQRTTHVQVTQTTTVTPTVTVGMDEVSSTASPSVAVSATSVSQRTTHVQVTHTTTVAPTVTVSMDAASSTASIAEFSHGTSVATSQLSSASATTTPMASQHDTRSGSSHVGLAVGVSVAVVASIIFMFLLYKFCKRSSTTKSSDIELGSVRSTRSAPVSHSNDYAVDPVALANAQNWQDDRGLQGYRYESYGAASRRASAFDVSPTALAHAQGWLSFGADQFQETPTYGGDAMSSSPVQFPTHVPPRKPVPAARPVVSTVSAILHLTMYLPRQNAEAQNDQGGRNIGPIPLPVFITLCIFGPSMVAFIFWFLYQNTIKRARNKKLREAQEQARIAEAKLMETHINHFLTNEEPGRR
ncbi:hypothetical protein GMOD_00009232 [Pyrenophora seminiperda CCB06]|uniref:Transmembrane protein n=1 Tax=Pyrenophora seminiperda CCB06 TaxID=1302712 RepID=A0A3M7MBP9_9PLEO|nr:hypothetical protein GMOD_00009232 [Pyrenophora seminiperda CCB06]